MPVLRLANACQCRRLQAIPLVLALGCASTALAPSADPNFDLACDNLPQARQSPLTLEQQLVRLRPVTRRELPGVPDEYEPTIESIAGVIASVPAAPGWSRAWLERRIACYRQLNPKSARDVLLVQGSILRVRENRGHFEVLITSDDARVAQQIADAAALSASSQAGPVATTR